jgi:regulator of protease activity HflC (stomatin/prohibitin superfamily)
VQIPFIERVAKVVPMSMQMMEIMQQPVIAQENVLVKTFITIYFQVIDPVSYVYGSHNTLETIELLAVKIMREIVCDIDSSEIRQNDENINYKMLTRLNEQLSAFGVEAKRADIVFHK